MYLHLQASGKSYEGSVSCSFRNKKVCNVPTIPHEVVLGEVSHYAIHGLQMPTKVIQYRNNSERNMYYGRTWIATTVREIHGRDYCISFPARSSMIRARLHWSPFLSGPAIKPALQRNGWSDVY